MKIAIGFVFLLGASIGLLADQDSVNILEKGPHHRVVERITQAMDGAGLPRLATNRVTEMGDGMHYWDGTDWQPTDPVFENAPGGASAQKVPYGLIIAPNLMDEGVVDFRTSDGKRFVSNPAFLAYRNITTGESVMVSAVKASVGKIISPTQILFEDAFEDIVGSIRFTISAQGIEQDILIQGNFPSPAELGLLAGQDPVRLEMWTLFSQAGDVEQAVVVKAGDQDDVELWFGKMRMGQGRAFQIGGEAEGVPVAKRWGSIDNPNEKWLVEMVHLDDVGPMLERLQGNARGNNARTKRTVQKVRTRSERELLAGFGRVFRGKEKRKETMLSMGKVNLPRGSAFVLDYQALSTGQANYTFQSDTTYYISGSLTMSGLTTFEGGSVIKFAPTNTATITVSSNVVWTGQAYRPVVMTARDDHSVGERIGTNALSGVYADVAFSINAAGATAGVTVNNLQIKHANTAIKIATRADHVFSNVQMVNCNSGIKLGANCGYALRNALFDNVKTNLTGGTFSTNFMEHITVDTADYFNFSGGNFKVNITNSILAAVTTVGTLANNANVAIIGSNSGLFQTSVNGKHYLADDTYRNQGSINVFCLSDIRKKTTYAPVTLTGPFSVSATWGPMATRDTDTPDLGFHYDPLDIVVKEETVYAPITLSGGVAVGVYGTYGLNLQSGAKFLSEGKPDALNRVVKCPAVQSSTNVWDTSGSTFALLRMTTTPSPKPDIHLRFTEVPLLADGVGRMTFLDAGSGYTRYTPNQIRFRDSQILNAELNMYPDTTGMPLSFTNCLFQRVNINLSDGSFGSLPMNVRLQNNTFIKGSLGLTHSTNTYTWGVFDNLFETTSLTAGGSVALSNGTNAYKGISVLASSLGGDLVLTTVDFQSGPLGNFYYNTNSSATNTAYLINRSTNNTPALVGLYHYTTRPDQAKDGDSSGLDMGFHYITTTGSSSTTPYDADGDGIPDYLEDLDGSGGNANSGEPDWQDASDPGLTVRITEPRNGVP